MSTTQNSEKSGDGSRSRSRSRNGGNRGGRRGGQQQANGNQSAGGAGGGAKKRSRNRNRNRTIKQPRPAPALRTRSRKSETIPALKNGDIRIVPLGGVEEIGRNMTAIEYKNDIIVVDCGFMFKEEDTPGVDYILPNTQYLEDRKDRIRGVIITHGHLDHIGGIPYIMDRIGNPPMYTRRLTSVMIQKRQTEFPHLPKLDIREIEGSETIRLGDWPVTFFAVTHTIPDSMGVIAKTPHGGIVVTGDIKLNHKDGVVVEEEEKSFSVFDNEKTLCLLMDSTNTERPGWSIPESTVFDTFEEIIARKSRGRLIIGTFASQLERVIKIIDIAERNGKKIVVEGRSMKNNIAIAQEIGLLKPKKDTLISLDAMGDYPPSRILVLATGAQGDQYAALMRISNRTHKFIRLTKDDTVVLSSSVIPGNERAVQKLKDNLSRQGANIITYQSSDVHASGHGNREEAQWIHRKINPKFFMPQHGYHYMLNVHGKIIQDSCDIPPENVIVPDNGAILEIREEGTKFVKLDVKAPNSTRVVEGQTVSDIQVTVMKDRQTLSEEGIFMIVATLNPKTGKLRKSPDIISRGFIYLRENQQLLQQTRLIIKKNVEATAGRSYPVNLDDVRDELVKAVEQFLLQQTNKRPIVIPVIVSV